MERTLNDMMNDLESAKKEYESLQKVADKALKKVNKINKEIEKYKIDNKLYYPMSELSKYIEREIIYIDLIEKTKSGGLTVKRIYNDEMFSVDENGHLHYSSYNCGVMDYDENINKYVEWCHYFRNEHDYIGFLELKLEEDDDE